MKTEPLIVPLETGAAPGELWAPSLTIREALPEDSGLYVVRVQNPLGSTAESACQLTVQG